MSNSTIIVMKSFIDLSTKCDCNPVESWIMNNE
jgi:hypothetical protein